MATFKVYYVKPQHVRVFGFAGPTPIADELETTHTYLRDVEAHGLDDVFTKCQGEVWSPNGEARELIESKGLLHTSMSVGDVIEAPDGALFAVAMFGFKRI